MVFFFGLWDKVLCRSSLALDSLCRTRWPWISVVLPLLPECGDFPYAPPHLVLCYAGIKLMEALGFWIPDNLVLSRGEAAVWDNEFPLKLSEETLNLSLGSTSVLLTGCLCVKLAELFTVLRASPTALSLCRPVGGPCVPVWQLTPCIQGELGHCFVGFPLGWSEECERTHLKESDEEEQNKDQTRAQSKATC